ncbi:MAG: hypothetical protein M1355_04250 [Patescibacteria group bacterium]|nr:hypothetical protein [Patescibacteria group bacterium]
MDIKKLSSKTIGGILDLSFLDNFTFTGILIFGAIFNITLLFIIFLGIKPSTNLIQLRFDSFYGVTETGNWYEFYFIYFISLLVFLVNSFLAIYFYAKEKLISYFLLVTNIAIQIFLTIQALNFINLINI